MKLEKKNVILNDLLLCKLSILGFSSKWIAQYWKNNYVLFYIYTSYITYGSFLSSLKPVNEAKKLLGRFTNLYISQLIKHILSTKISNIRILILSYAIELKKKKKSYCIYLINKYMYPRNTNLYEILVTIKYLQIYTCFY